ncbi:MAG: hypothetical protein Q8O53_01640 [Candidatus Moranbacteria bacterium]|nr:hypothetical protein [Candidatus Moranbacteria bacterium]
MKNVFIISGAAGSGKDSVIDGLRSLFSIERIITSTTRARRSMETEGHPYYFLSRQDFKHNITAGNFVEYSTNENGELYGVTKSELARIASKNSIVIWRVDWKGVIAIKKLYPKIPAIYISAPIEILEARLRARDTEKDESYFQERMEYTREWLNHLDIYDYQIENEEGRLEHTIEQVAQIIKTHSEQK